jgi:hypothetical protein
MLGISLRDLYHLSVVGTMNLCDIRSDIRGVPHRRSRNRRNVKMSSLRKTSLTPRRMAINRDTRNYTVLKALVTNLDFVFRSQIYSRTDSSLDWMSGLSSAT